jgi:hypothetical protein
MANLDRYYWLKPRGLDENQLRELDQVWERVYTGRRAEAPLPPSLHSHILDIREWRDRSAVSDVVVS